MKNKSKENYLDFIYDKNPAIKWDQHDDEVVLQIENKGMFNRIAQALLKKPKISYIHMEEIGSFVWPLIDGTASVYEIGVKVKEHFGEKAEPLYERLSLYFKQLENYGFVMRKND